MPIPIAIGTMHTNDTNSTSLLVFIRIIGIICTHLYNRIICIIRNVRLYNFVLIPFWDS